MMSMPIFIRIHHLVQKFLGGVMLHTLISKKVKDDGNNRHW